MTFAAFSVVVVAFLAASYLRDRMHFQERRELYQRIQAPELAVIERVQQDVATDDNSWPLSDEESAAEQQRAIAEIERLEREGL